MRKILIPSDLTDISENALRLAMDMPETFNAEIYLVNFTKHPLGESFAVTGDVDKKYVNEDNVYAISLVKRYYKQLAELATRYSTETRPIHYKIYDSVLKKGVTKFVKENDIDLIIMGTSGEESAEEFFSGNHTEQVIEVATCPVISIKENYKKGDLSKIVLGLSTERDRKDNFLKATNYLNDLAESLNAEIEIVNVVDPGKDSKIEREKELSEFASKFDLRNYTISVVPYHDKEKGLINFASERNAGLLAVFTHAEDGFFRILRSSLSEHLSMHSETPVVTINLHNI
ncbi:universal stress protein [Fulvivirga sp. 29W222]|uniref:Universal stress protein n=1 Tax=Fulvivirga marina TaxID=2494733 RepID=A0A937G3T6_9BACT|nr:universal stress protein [Fulvivirga marina]MBL6449513.1 universal stress protein [Fulvivirga marina]